MFSFAPHLLRNAKDLAVAFLTLEDGEEARREAGWEGRSSARMRRPPAPAASIAEWCGSSADASVARLSVARVSPQATRALRSHCSTRSHCKVLKNVDPFHRRV